MQSIALLMYSEDTSYLSAASHIRCRKEYAGVTKLLILFSSKDENFFSLHSTMVYFTN